MYKVIIWGTGETYNEYFNLIKYEEQKKSIKVVAVTSNEDHIRESVDGFRFLQKEKISGCEYDLCLVAIKSLSMPQIKKEASQIGIPEEKLIPIRVLALPYFDLKKYIELKKGNLSIISSNCWGGVVYHRLGLEFLSPTINMFFLPPQFNQFAENLKYYLSQPVKYRRMDFNHELKMEYPVGVIDDIELHFNHMKDFDEAAALWDKRKKRVNYDNLLLVAYSESDAEVLRRFEKLDYENKIIFTGLYTDSPYAVRLNLNERGGIPVNETAWGVIPLFDLLELAIHGERYLRIDSLMTEKPCGGKTENNGDGDKK